jgi:hypothetical protein
MPNNKLDMEDRALGTRGSRECRFPGVFSGAQFG